MTTHDPQDRHIVLIGMMGSGKTTTGTAIANRLGRPLRDCDVDLETREGRSGAEIAEIHGIDRLHELEETVLLYALAEDAPAVITAAGWVVESPRCRDAMAERALVVWLDAPLETLIPRMAGSDHRRPLDRSDAEELLDRRSSQFEKVADIRVDARMPHEELVARVLTQLSESH